MNLPHQTNEIHHGCNVGLSHFEEGQFPNAVSDVDESCDHSGAADKHIEHAQPGRSIKHSTLWSNLKEKMF